MTDSLLVILPILLPLAGAVLTFLLARTVRAGGPLVLAGLLFSGGIAVAAGALAVLVASGGVQDYQLGGWSAPLGIELRADGLGALMVLVSGVVGAAVGVYSVGYFAEEPETARYFWPLWMFLWAAINSIFLSGDIFNLYVGLEILSLAAVALVTLSGGAALAAGLRYLLVSLLGSMAYLMGVALLYGAYGTLDIATLSALIEAGPAVWAAAALMSVGLLMKTALFPLHFWLPPAHADAPGPVSALLSALVVKASFYLLLRLWFELFEGAAPGFAAQMLGALGAAAIVWGSLLALRQERLKLLVAYSTVAQIGYLFLLFPLAGATTGAESGTFWAAGGWAGGVYYAVAHACAKGAMFMAASTVLKVTGTDKIGKLRGLVERLPLTVTTFGVSGITLMGLPPSGGFTGKWLLLGAAIESGQWWYVAVVLAGGLLAAAYLLRFLTPAFTLDTEGVAGNAHDRSYKVSPSMEFAALLLAALSLVLGLVSAPLLGLLEVGAPFAEGISA